MIPGQKKTLSQYLMDHIIVNEVCIANACSVANHPNILMLVIPRIVGANILVIGYYSSQMTKNALIFPPLLKKILQFTHLDWQKMPLNCPP